MISVTLAYGAILALMGLVGYLAAGSMAADGRASPTALIPTAIGAVILLCGVLARSEKLRMHAIHAALVVALIAILGTAGGLLKAFAWIFGTTPERPMAVAVQALTAVLSIGFIALGIRSFRAARLAREAGAAPR